MTQTWLAKLKLEEKLKKEAEEKSKLQQFIISCPPSGLPRLPKNEILGKIECDNCKELHLSGLIPLKGEMEIPRRSIHMSPFIVPSFNHNRGWCRWAKVVTLEECYNCKDKYSNGDPRFTNCLCPCHKTRPRIKYTTLTNREEAHGYYETHWTEHDLASEGKTIFEKAREKNVG